MKPGKPGEVFLEQHDMAGASEAFEQAPRPQAEGSFVLHPNPVRDATILHGGRTPDTVMVTADVLPAMVVGALNLAAGQPEALRTKRAKTLLRGLFASGIAPATLQLEDPNDQSKFTQRHAAWHQP
jgi:hypothetical protein